MNTDPEHVSKDIPSGTPEDAPLPPLVQRAPVTAALLALCSLLYAVTLAGTLLDAPSPLESAFESLWSLNSTESNAILRKLGALELSRVWVDGEWWRVFSTGLLHGSLLHLALNMLALLSIGEWVEHAWGRLRMLLLFVISCVGGALASLAWCESSLVLGASAGILGQAGALWLARRFGPPALQESLAPISATNLAVVILVCLLLGVWVPGIAQAGHLGGLVAGLLLGGAWVFRPLPVRFILEASLVILLGSLTWLGTAPTNRPNYFNFRGSRLAEEGLEAEALNLFKRGLELDPESAHFRNEIAYRLALGGYELDYAERLSLESLEREPLNANYVDTLAWIWCRQGHIEAGLQLLHAAVFLADEPSSEFHEHIETCAAAQVFHVEHSTPPSSAGLP